MSQDLGLGVYTERFETYCRSRSGEIDRTWIAANIRRMDAVIRDPEIAVTLVSQENRPLDVVHGAIEVPLATVDPHTRSSLDIRRRKVGTATPTDTWLIPA
ncbi:MAG: hypothetical protein U1F36_08580 [Planctomycetota bacterium]